MNAPNSSPVESEPVLFLFAESQLCGEPVSARGSGPGACFAGKTQRIMPESEQDSRSSPSALSTRFGADRNREERAVFCKAQLRAFSGEVDAGSPQKMRSLKAQQAKAPGQDPGLSSRDRQIDFFDQ
jgi:hypothetical protein